MSFQNRDYEKEIELSQHIWNMKVKGGNFNIKLSVPAKAFPYASVVNAVTYT